MNFNRYRCQEFIESEVGCTDPTELALYKDQILAYELPLTKVDELRESIRVDSESLFYKAMLSFLEAIYGIVNNHSSWAIVKLYYSAFYSLRCKLLISGYAPVKNGKGSIFFLKCGVDEKPSKVPGKERGDHKVTIKAFSHFLSHTLLTNTVDGNGVSVFNWMMDYRELVNYRVDTFIEPEFGYDVIPSFSDPDDLEVKLANYIGDENLTYCFLSSHCILATPFVLLCEAYKDMEKAGDDFSISDERKLVLKNIVDKIGLSDTGFVSKTFDL
ncbi:hypothetical protein OAY_10635 [Vibrio cyclitrophicus ZF205]|uniref:hypothetical protein n=1 Tax=Vibrio cyclitrophicus TaxID=47951 RepID=UPI000316DF7C|nr:hypothetical protein [Vibrio cyclitrophicus]OEE17295.1 hypothetical protein OAY_10635 [Vibrio cyclitrophicus ZF205]